MKVLGKPIPFQVANRNPTHVVVEVFGGDNNLSKYVQADLHEMVDGNRGPFAVLALADYRRAGAEVIEITADNGQRVIEKLGEINTGDSETICAFIARALVTYSKVSHVALGFWDHGSGVFDEFDPHEAAPRSLRKLRAGPKAKHPPARRLFAPKEPHLRAMLNDDTNGDLLTNYEAHLVVKTAFKRAGRSAPLDLLFSDTCLNGMVEVCEQFKDFAQVIIGSEELEPGDGWDYTGWFSKMTAAPPGDASTWARQAVRCYATAYRSRPEEHPCTLAAFTAQNAITPAFKAFVRVLAAHRDAGFSAVRDARETTQSFAGSDTYDLQDFATRCAGATKIAAIREAARALATAVSKARVDSCALGDEVVDAHGLAFWLPTGSRGYTRVAPTYAKLEFDKAVGWSKYLGRQYGG